MYQRSLSSGSPVERLFPSGFGEKGFTLVEVLIALVLVAMATVTVGYFATGVARNHNYSNDLSRAMGYADDTMELITIHGDLNHPEVRESVTRASLNNVRLNVTSENHRKPGTKTVLSKVTIRFNLSTSDTPVVLSRLINLKGNPDA